MNLIDGSGEFNEPSINCWERNLIDGRQPPGRPGCPAPQVVSRWAGRQCQLETNRTSTNVLRGNAYGKGQIPEMTPLANHPPRRPATETPKYCLYCVVISGSRSLQKMTRLISSWQCSTPFKACFPIVADCLLLPCLAALLPYLHTSR